MHFLDILVVFTLDRAQISFNLVENAFVTRQLALLATKITFYDILAHAWAEIKILIKIVTYVFSFSIFDISFFLSFFSFSFLFFLLQGLTFYWACLQLKNF